MSGTVNPDQYAIIKQFEDNDKSTLINIGVAKLFTANSLKWTYTGLVGGLCLTIDRKLKGAPLFRLYDLNSFQLLFQNELYYNFNRYYQELNDQFHCYPIKGSFLIGFSFSDSNEALKMKSDILLYSPQLPQNVFHAEIDDSLISSIRENRENGRNLIPSSLLRNINMNNKSPKKNPDYRGDIIQNSMVIYKPEDFSLVSHIGWNEKLRTFDFSNLSKEYKQVFKNAGLKKNELKDADTALAIYETLFNHAVINKGENIRKKKPQAAGNAAGASPSTNMLASKARSSHRPDIDNKQKDHQEEEAQSIPLAPALNFAMINPASKRKSSVVVKLNPHSLSGLPRVSNSEAKSKKNLPNIEEEEILSMSKPPPVKEPVNVLSSNKNPDPNDRGVLLDQIKNGIFNLKKVQKDDRPPIVQKQLSKQEEMSLTSILAKAIADRRKQITKNDVEDQEESDWSDD